MTYLGGKAICIAALMTLIPLAASLKAQKPQIPNPPSDYQQIDEAPEPMLRSLMLRWTAPGDDGNIGRAAGYDLRYVQAAAGPIDTEAEWNAATQVEGEPLPSAAGQRDSARVSGLRPGFQYYFCIKACDEANNLSPLSNSPLISINTPIYAFAVGDVNNSGNVDGLDVVFLINALQGKNSIPMPDLRADVDGKCDINGLDVSYLRAYLSGGPDLRSGKCAQDPAQLSVIHLKTGDGN